MTGNADGKVVFEVDMNTKGFDEEIEATSKKLRELIDTYKEEQKELGGSKVYEKKLQERRIEIEKTRNALIDLKKKQLGLQEGIDDSVTSFKDILKKVTDSSNKILKRILRWGVALFGIRSAYTAIRQAMATIGQYDKTLKSNVDYIRYAVAMSLKPIIEWIINAVYKLLQYINYIAQRWFGKNLFENAGAKAFKEANKNAKEYQKTLAGFDEMDILKKVDNTNEINPTFDLSKQLSDRDVPTWIKWIGDHKDVFQAVAEGFAILFGAKAIATILSATRKIIGTKSTASAAGSGLFGVYALLLLIGGVTFYKLAQNLGELEKKVSDLKDDLEEATKNEKKIRSKEEDTWETFWEKYYSEEGLDENTIHIVMQAAKRQIVSDSENIFDEIQENLKYHFGDLTATLFGMSPYGSWRDLLIEKAKSIFSNFQQIKKAYGLGLITDEDYKNSIENVKKTIDYVEKTIGPLKGTTIAEKYFGMSDKDYQNLKKDLDKHLSKLNLTIPAKIEIDPNQALKDLEKLKGSIFLPNYMYNALKNKLESMKTKKNAMGGIINLPNRGVTLGYTGMTRQVGGEAGYEGLIPMDNASQMELIGRAVAKYTTINLTNITKLDNREIAREQKKINAENDFAYNR